MKPAILFFLSALSLSAISQTASLRIISDSGKVEFNKQVNAKDPDYSGACRILKNQVRQYPDDAELHYFLGYALDRLNSVEGSTMNQLKKNMTIEASEHFETVNRLQPTYKGEYIVLDPYAKLASIWGSLAQSYLVRGEKDSAIWAFSEGKKRGGFIEPVLHFNRQLLNSCASNAIFVTVGDNITIPCWYLQTVEKFRTDITIVDANMINTTWYTKYLKHREKLAISFSDEEVEQVDYVEFEPRFITITNPADSMEKFTWELKPTYYGKYLLKGDRILLNIFKENLFSRPVYYSSGSDSTTNLFLGDYFHEEGLVAKIRLKGVDFNEAPDSVSHNFTVYSIEKLSADEIQRSKDAVILLNNYRWVYYTTIGRLLEKGQKEKARALKNEMEVKFPLSKLPYAFEGAGKYFKQLFDSID